MRATRIIMGMPITVDVVDAPDGRILDDVFAYFEDVDRRFSTYRDDSEVAAINQGRLAASDYSDDMRKPDGSLDPSGIVKGWAIRNAGRMVAATGARDYFIDAGGDIESSGVNASGKPWSVGIRSPFDMAEIIKVVYPRGRGIATSGSYVRGQHIYTPQAPGRPIADIVSLTVIGADVLEADRFATAAFAMGGDGIAFIQQTPGIEGYVVRSDGRATLTSGFGAYCTP